MSFRAIVVRKDEAGAATAAIETPGGLAKDPSAAKILGARIIDRPRYRWRGMMLDCCRHFMDKEFVKRYIDLLAAYEPALVEAYAAGMRAKLGLREEHSGDRALDTRLLALMEANRVDYTNLFRDLAEFRVNELTPAARLRDRFIDRAGFDACRFCCDRNPGSGPPKEIYQNR